MRESSSSGRGARLTLPRDLQVAYLIGRMGAVRLADVWRAGYGSPHTARSGFGRLGRLGLLRSYPRLSPSLPKWFGLTPEGFSWVLEESGCNEEELRAPSGIARLNLSSLAQRNRLWVSLILAGRASSTVRLALFRPEAELRQMASSQVPIVPDALFVLERRQGQKPHAPGGGIQAIIAAVSSAWMVELDSGSERSAVWIKKAELYRDLRNGRSLYGEEHWSVLAIVPSARRAQAVAAAVVKGGAGAFTVIALASSLEDGRAFERALWTALDLSGNGLATASHSLCDALLNKSPTPSAMRAGKESK